MIKAFGTLIIAFTLAISSHIEKNNEVIDGLYKLEYEPNFNTYYSFLSYVKFDKGKCTGSNNSGIVFKGDLIKETDTSYIIRYKYVGIYNEDSSEAVKLLTRMVGKDCIRIYKTKPDSLFFEGGFTNTLHVIKNRGVMVKVK